MNILSGLANGQVLQRLGSQGATVILKGTSTADGPIQATLSQGNKALEGWKKRPVGKVVAGKFSVKLISIPVGGPYSLRLEAEKQHIDVAPFFVGDVWVMAGQSNMEGAGDMTGKAKPHPLIRAFSMRREWRLAEEPLHRTMESPDACHTAVQCSVTDGEQSRRLTAYGVGVGLFFAREMLKRSGGVPQGLICTAHGGTSMQQWSPGRKHLGGESLYASMLTSVRTTGQPVSGMLWYQGESDANPQDIIDYTPRMKALVAASRRDLRQSKLPWIIVQLARVFIEWGETRTWNGIQEQQRLLPEKIKFLETVPAIDLPLDDLIHIGSEGFPRLAARMASEADWLVYGKKREDHTPRLRTVRAVDTPPRFNIEVEFDFVQGGLRSKGEPTGFNVVTSSGKPLPVIYKTKLKGDTVTLRLDKKPTGNFGLFYGHGFTPYCNITDARGFSLPFFGPFPLDNSEPKAFTPFVTLWKISEVIPASKPLDQVQLRDVKALSTTVKSYSHEPIEGFINEHNAWQSKTGGQAFFHSCLQLSEPMKLEFLMGYDGPFRLWLDGKPFFTNMAGLNPAFADESGKIASLKAGKHDLHVGMDLNSGRAWGFFLRMARKDVSKKQILTGNFVRPTYSV